MMMTRTGEARSNLDLDLNSEGIKLVGVEG